MLTNKIVTNDGKLGRVVALRFAELWQIKKGKTSTFTLEDGTALIIYAAQNDQELSDTMKKLDPDAPDPIRLERA